MNWLDSYSVALQATVVAFGFAGITIAGLFIVRRLVPWETLRENHEVAGFTFGVVGAFYGVVLAFVIVAAWQRYENANEKAQLRRSRSRTSFICRADSRNRCAPRCVPRPANTRVSS